MRRSSTTTLCPRSTSRWTHDSGHIGLILWKWTTVRRYAAEFLGTALLVFVGVGSAIFALNTGGVIVVGLCFGLVMLVLAYALAPVSGAHLNPAVTLGTLLSRKISPAGAVGYWVAQVLGAILAAFVLWLLVRQGRVFDETGVLGASEYGAHINAGGTVVLEFILTFLFVLVVLLVTSRTEQTSIRGVAIGLALGLCNLVAIPLDGGSINPARSIGPALFNGGAPLRQLWLFIVVPLLAGAAAAFVAPLFVHGQREAPKALAPRAEDAARWTGVSLTTGRGQDPDACICGGPQGRETPHPQVASAGSGVGREVDLRESGAPRGDLGRDGCGVDAGVQARGDERGERRHVGGGHAEPGRLGGADAQAVDVARPRARQRQADAAGEQVGPAQQSRGAPGRRPRRAAGTRELVRRRSRRGRRRRPAARGRRARRPAHGRSRPSPRRRPAPRPSSRAASTASAAVLPASKFAVSPG